MTNRHQYSNQWQLFVQSIQTRSLSRRFFLLMGASTLIASACTRAGLLDNQPSNSASETVKRVKHAFGETEVPANPTRVIALGYTTVEAVVAHGVQPIGVPSGVVDELRHLSLDRATMSEIGDPNQPNLEKIAALKPDLILTSKYSPKSLSYPSFRGGLGLREPKRSQAEC